MRSSSGDAHVQNGKIPLTTTELCVIHFGFLTCTGRIHPPRARITVIRMRRIKRYVKKKCDRLCTDYKDCRIRELFESIGILAEYKCETYGIIIGPGIC